MNYKRTIFDEPHQQSLEFLAVQALESGDTATGFAYADRSCRIAPLPGPHNYTLRGEALFQMGDKVAAIADLARALYLAPEDIAANRRMLAWAEGAQKNEAALALIRRERDVKILREAIDVLRADGRRQIGHAQVNDDAIRGWAIWRGQGALEMTVASEVGILAVLIEPDSFHPLADLGRATNFDLRRPKSPVPQSIVLSVGGEMIYSTRAPANEAPLYGRPRLKPDPVGPAPPAPRAVAVVVPVFGDFESVQICLESLLSALTDTSHHRVLVVNDAVPDPRIAKFLNSFANNSSVLLLTNPRNLGFVGSVNRALEQLVNEDVILLNSDTIVPKDFIARLAEAAASAPDIGTVTPLSNNGEEVSFPVANKANPLGSKDDVAAIDAIAAAVNTGRVVDMPSGIGFCLYITRACLDAVGFLSEDFYRGYVEDVEVCLHARAKGFRSVCAPSVYVGHAGTKSFGQEKRALVVRNFAVLDHRYPAYQAESVAFTFADPLAQSRQAIERSMPPSAKQPRLLLTGAGVMAIVTRERARQLISEQTSAMIVEVHYEATGPKARIFDAAGGIPQSLQFDLASPSECDAMMDYTRAAGPSAIEILDPAHVPLALVDRLLELGVRHDMFVGDATLVADRDVRATAAVSLRDDGFDPAFMAPNDDQAEKNRAKRWQDIADAADRILVPSEYARAYALKRFAESRLHRIVPAGDNGGELKGRRRGRAVWRLGLLPVRSCGEEQSLIAAIARAVRSSRPTAELTVVGATLDDLGLMQIGNTFVTGAVDSADFKWALRSYGLQALFLATTRPLFGHPSIDLAFACGLPVVYFDWSMGRLMPRKGGLALDPSISFTEMMKLIERWMAKS